ncbi:MAG: 50S ribosomal protein L11 [Rickettsiales bacterium]|nr:50S ribosomal protein L11 [Rickettsiales bacterium]
MAKEVTGQIKLQIGAGKANPSPPVGPALGQAGLNIMEFCKAFNAATGDKEPGTPIPVVISVYKDRSFTFEMKLPPVSFYIKKAINLKKGSGEAGKVVAGKITYAQIKDIAEQKMQDLNAHTVEAAMRMVEGSAISMGLEVVE